MNDFKQRISNTKTILRTRRKWLLNKSTKIFQAKQSHGQWNQIHFQNEDRMWREQRNIIYAKVNHPRTNTMPLVWSYGIKATYNRIMRPISTLQKSFDIKTQCNPRDGSNPLRTYYNRNMPLRIQILEKTEQNGQTIVIKNR